MTSYSSVVLGRSLPHLLLLILTACGARSGLHSLADSTTGGATLSSSGGASGAGGNTLTTTVFGGGASGAGGNTLTTTVFGGGASAGGNSPFVTTFNAGASTAGGSMMNTGGSHACGPQLTTCATGTQVSCIDLQSDLNHCGACGRACKSDWHCTAGECRAPACKGTFTFGPRLIEFQPDSTPQLSSLAAADFNKDGLLDLVVTDYANGVVGVRLSEGNGRFGTAAFYPTVDSAAILTVADFNGDGNLDLFAIEFHGNASVLFGNGHGAFAPKQDVTLGAQVNQVAVGDINGDHMPDLVTTSYPSPTLNAFSGRGDGSFAPAGDYTLRQRIDSVSMVDLNGDNSSDVVALWEESSSPYGHGVTILLGNPDGSLTRATELEVDDYAYWLAVGDVNNDGAADVIASGGRGFAVLFGDGKGGFSSSLTTVAGGFAALGDLNRDGNLDAITVNQDVLPETASVMLGGGDGTFTNGETVSFGIGEAPVIGDFNGDAVPDLAGISYDGVAVAIMSGKGDGTFADTVSIQDAYCPVAVALSDLNRDGNLDLLTANSSPSINAHLNPLQGSNEPTMSWDLGLTPTQVITGDIDADGLTDLVTPNDDGAISVRFGKGTGTWSNPVDIPSTGLQPVTLKDMNNDGLLDILRLVPSPSDYALSIWWNMGGRTFSPPKTYPSGRSLNDFAVGDLDDDQLPDVVLATASATVQIALHGGDIASPVEYPAPVSLDQLRVADVTGDGKLDVIGLHTDPSIVVVFPGQGDGTIDIGRQYPTSEYGDSLLVYDVDGDRNLDIVSASWSGTTLLKGNGAGAFSTSLVALTPDMPPHWYDPTAIGDVNGDGWPDLVLKNTTWCTTDVMFGKCW